MQIAPATPTLQRPVDYVLQLIELAAHVPARLEANAMIAIDRGEQITPSLLVAELPSSFAAGVQSVVAAARSVMPEAAAQLAAIEDAAAAVAQLLADDARDTHTVLQFSDVERMIASYDRPLERFATAARRLQPA